MLHPDLGLFFFNQQFSFEARKIKNRMATLCQNYQILFFRVLLNIHLSSLSQKMYLIGLLNLPLLQTLAFTLICFSKLNSFLCLPHLSNQTHKSLRSTHLLPMNQKMEVQ